MSHSQRWETLNSNYANEAKQLVDLINEAEAIVIGIGAGVSAANGFTYTGDRFIDNFGDFIEKHNFFDMLEAASFGYKSTEEYWAFQSRFGLLNYINQPVGQSYIDLRELMEGKNYHIITTNADNSLRVSGYDREKVYYYQGEFGYMQCSRLCHPQIYYGDEKFQEMVEKQENMRVPYEIIPRCPQCDAPMEIFKRTEKGMVEDEDYKGSQYLYHEFLKENTDKKVLFLELGVGFTAPYIIKHPFQDMVRHNPQAIYTTVNIKKYRIAKDIKEQTVYMNTDLVETLEKARNIMKA